MQIACLEFAFAYCLAALRTGNLGSNLWSNSGARDLSCMPYKLQSDQRMLCWCPGAAILPKTPAPDSPPWRHFGAAPPRKQSWTRIHLSGPHCRGTGSATKLSCASMSSYLTKLDVNNNEHDGKESLSD